EGPLRRAHRPAGAGRAGREDAGRAGDGARGRPRPRLLAGDRERRRGVGGREGRRGGARRLPHRRAEARDLLRVVRAGHQLTLRRPLHDRDRRRAAPGPEARGDVRAADRVRDAAHRPVSDGDAAIAARRGLFVVFEGPEGAGKSTQIARLAERMRSAGRDVLLTREPGGTRAGDAVRGVLLDPEQVIYPLTEFLLYSASRAQLVAEVIGPALASGRDVVSDRFTGASVAYQGYGRGLDLELVAAL